MKQQFNIELVTGGKLPTKAHATDADYDIYARLDKPIIIPPGGRVLIPAGFKAEIPPGWRFKLESRSGLGWKQGVMIGAGVIDSGYENEICVVVHNTNPPEYKLDVYGEDFNRADFSLYEEGRQLVINPGDKIAQFAIERVWDTELVQVEKIECRSERSMKGFGSTGV